VNRILLAIAFVTVASLATAGPRGAVPKASADLYAAHAGDEDWRFPDESSAVAGYLYFPMLPRKKHTALQLEHETKRKRQL
jgi:hypothetical protein